MDKLVYSPREHRVTDQLPRHYKCSRGEYAQALSIRRRWVGKAAASCAAMLFLTPLAIHAQIPVTDAAAITRSWEGHLEEIAKWADQLNAMKQQYAQLQRQYDALTGSSGMGQLMKQGLRQQLPDDFTQSYERLILLGRAGASEDARAIYEAVKQRGCDGWLNENARQSCEAKHYAEPENAAYINKALQLAQTRANQLQQLLNQIDGATDLKTATDLGNRISAEQTLLENEQTLVNLALAQRQSQAALIAQANAERNRKRLLENDHNPMTDIWK